MEFFCLVVVGMSALFLIYLGSQPQEINTTEILKQLPKARASSPVANRPVSGMIAARQRQQELKRVVVQEPDAAAQTVKQWLQE